MPRLCAQQRALHVSPQRNTHIQIREMSLSHRVYGILGRAETETSPCLSGHWQAFRCRAWTRTSLFGSRHRPVCWQQARTQPPHRARPVVEMLPTLPPGRPRNQDVSRRVPHTPRQRRRLVRAVFSPSYISPLESRPGSPLCLQDNTFAEALADLLWERTCGELERRGGAPRRDPVTRGMAEAARI